MEQLGNTAAEGAEETPVARKIYTTPQLTALGGIDSLVRAGSGHGPDGGNQIQSS